MGSTRTRIAVSLSVSVAAVSVLAGAAGARNPDADFADVPVQVRPAVVAVPDAFERAVQRRTRVLEAKYSSADAVARAIAHRSR